MNAFTTSIRRIIRMDDLQAIRRLRDGDIGGLEILVARYQEKAVRAAFLITHDELLAEDVVQDTFVHLSHRIRQFDLARPFEPYLLRSVVNAALNAARRAERQISLDSDPQQVENLLTQAASVEAEVDYLQLKQMLIAALSKLEPRQRAVVVQRYYLEMSEKEMAVALDAPPGTIKWLLNTARAKLRDLLGSERSAE
jgi:RNA polymerase sigma-70 factor (ECF subfamily)